MSETVQVTIDGSGYSAIASGVSRVFVQPVEQTHTIFFRVEESEPGDDDPGIVLEPEEDRFAEFSQLEAADTVFARTNGPTVTLTVIRGGSVS